VFCQTVLINLMTFLSGALWRGHVAILSNFIQETACTGPELYFSQSMLLIYGINCLSPLILVRYHYSCEMCMACIYLAVCFYKSSILFICWATFSAFCTSLSNLSTSKDDNDDVDDEYHITDYVSADASRSHWHIAVHTSQHLWMPLYFQTVKTLPWMPVWNF